MAHLATRPIPDDLYSEQGMGNWQQRVGQIDHVLASIVDELRGRNNRDVALAVTKLQEAQLWLAKSLYTDERLPVAQSNDDDKVKRA